MNEPNRILTRADIASMNDDILSRFLASPPTEARAHGVRVTSGTSGSGPIVAVREHGPSSRVRFSGLNRLLLFHGAYNRKLAEVLHVRNQVEEGPKRALLICTEDLSPELAALVEDFVPDTVTGITSLVARLSHYVGRAGSGVRVLILAGERVTSQSEDLLRSSFPHAKIRMRYSSVELGEIGYQCTYLSPNQYHPSSGVTIEVVDTDESGSNILVSKRMRVGSVFEVFEHYDIGDVARLQSDTCPCGEAVTFEHLGRKGHDYFTLAGAILRREEFDRVAAFFKEYIDDYRAEASEILENGELKGKIVLHVFAGSPIPTPALAEEITRDFSASVFLTPTRTLADLVAAGVFVPLEVEFSKTPFPQKHKDIKLVRLDG